ncbi:MerR family transcriptional regulator [Streptomyces alkaliphilus]|uniref:MerR family transcriptional regulator n=1 Tax=Streptomyces alkaliphilus TaxID=1472722 RepID=UPI0011807A81|nr:MerR family transcriptional regulator [Streptomyces alkaliphilus]MQS09544.1 MerR family transcriptional regulator [Streptomyces alkaliphilus]
MRIGEIAALVGVSTRTVRHYHRMGLLPEPPRRGNGYREYRLRDAVTLARVRRLAELGLSLEEVRNTLAADRGRSLREVLSELDADLARQQAELTARRRRLAALLEEADPHPDSVVSPEMASVLRGLPAGASGTAVLDREMLALMDTGLGDAERAALAELFRPLTESGAPAGARDIYKMLDDLADAEPDDPRVAVVVDRIADYLPKEMVSAMLRHLDAAGDRNWWEELSHELAPAQVETFRRLVTVLRERR